MLNYGKCKNIGICNKANIGELILITDAKNKCPECEDELHFAVPKEFSWLQRALPITLIVSTLGLGGLWTANGKKSQPVPKPTPSAAIAPPAAHAVQKNTAPLQVAKADALKTADLPGKTQPVPAYIPEKPLSKPATNKPYKKVRFKHPLAKPSRISLASVTPYAPLQYRQPPAPHAAIVNAAASNTSARAIAPKLKTHTHQPDKLQKQLELAKQKLLHSKQAAPQPVIDEQETAARDRAASRLSLSRLGVEFSGESLVAATKKGDLKVVKLLVDSGLPANINSHNGETPLVVSRRNLHKYLEKQQTKTKQGSYPEF